MGKRQPFLPIGRVEILEISMGTMDIESHMFLANEIDRTSTFHCICYHDQTINMAHDPYHGTYRIIYHKFSQQAEYDV